MNLADRIKQRRVALNLTQKEVAERTGITQQSLQKIEDGKTQNPRNILDLARALGCQPDWLLFGKDDPSHRVSSKIEYQPDIKGLFPLIDWAQAGAWSCLDDQASVQKAEKYPCPVTCSDRSFVLRIQGISMQPTFSENELIFVDPGAEATSGKYVVAKLDNDNEAIFRQLVIEGQRKFLKPANPNWPEQLIAIDEDCTIIGVVVFSGRVFK